MKGIELGSVVFSKAGRDAGRFYIVTEIVSDEFVRIADGELRRIDKPKLKKIRHLRVEAVNEKLAEKLRDGKKVFDAEIRSNLRSYNGSI